MGMDTVIHFRFNPTAEFPYIPTDAVIYTDKDRMIVEKATHVIYLGTRYYSKEYPRGHWPTIASILMSLMGSPGVEKVWYGSDFDENPSPSPFTIEELFNITKHYLTYSNDQYYW